MAKGNRGGKRTMAGVSTNNTSKQFVHNGKNYREVGNKTLSINDGKYLPLEFEYKGKWHKVQNISLMISLYNTRHGKKNNRR